MDSSRNESKARADAIFRTTRWSVVLKAGAGDCAGGFEALQTLCSIYWYPLYAFIRRRGYLPEEAQDLTQEFFARLIEGKDLEIADPEKGRFRGFLLTSLKHFLSNERDRKQAQKRGGEYTFVSWEQNSAEGRYEKEPAHDLTPEKMFERRWALTVLETAIQQLRKEYVRAGKADLFDTIQVFLSGETSQGLYASLALELQMSEGSLRVAVHRLRGRYAHLVRQEIERTVSKAETVDEELQHLIAVLSESASGM
jgi:RNA polymerase sigma factor (sigma-70 family)